MTTSSRPLLAPAERAQTGERSRSEIAAEPARGSIGVWDAVSIIVGIVIGAGIYETAPLVLANVASPLAGLGVWALGGVLSLIGACCYAELASAYPHSGGDYVYLSRAFGRPAGFLFAWAQLAVILTGSIGMMAYVFADYASAAWSLGPSSTPVLAALAVIALTALNLSSFSAGKATQNVLSALKILGLLAIVFAGFWWGTGAPVLDRAERSGAESSLGLAMVLVLYTYGGWNDAALVAADVREPRRNLPRALLLGTAVVTLVYLLVNAAFITGLGFQSARTSEAIAADVLAGPFGDGAGRAMSVLVMVSALGAVNALVFTGSRVHASLGADYGALAWLGRSSRRGSPWGALLAQALVSLGLIVLCGTVIGRSAVDGLLVRAGFAPARWVGHGGFDTLLRCSAPVFWTFFLLTSLSLFVLRAREPRRERPYRVPLYPVVPLLFSATCLYMLYSSVAYAGSLTFLGVALALSGIPFWLLSKRRPPRAGGEVHRPVE